MANPQVLIVGAGPVGLSLAIALRRAGIKRVLVVDKRPSRDERSRWSRAGVHHAGSLEVWRILGFAEKMIARGTQMSIAHFAAGPTYLQVNPGVLGVKHSHNLAITQAVTEDVLLDEADEAGVEFAWGLDFEGMRQDDGQGIVVARFKALSSENGLGSDVVTTREIAASWLVGCDGTRSKVRDAAGLTLNVVEESYGAIGWLADGYVSPGTPNLTRGSHRESGTALLATNGDGTHRFVGVVTLDGKGDSERLPAPTEERVRELATLVFGQDYGFHDMRWSSTFSSAGKCTDSLRSGRVFIAGDAAHHFFPVGGQGMNTGILDALNLSWKLGLLESGRKFSKQDFEKILDSYSTERVEAAKAVIRNVAIQTQFLVNNTPALWDFLAETLTDPVQNRLWAHRFTGFGDPTEPYRQQGSDETDVQRRLVGTRVAHLSIETMDAMLAPQAPQPLTLVLFDTKESSGTGKLLLEAASAWGEAVRSVGCSAEDQGDAWKGVLAALVRPDFRVAWVVDSDTEPQVQVSSLQECLASWLGKRGEL